MINQEKDIFQNDLNRDGYFDPETKSIQQQQPPGPPDDGFGGAVAVNNGLYLQLRPSKITESNINVQGWDDIPQQVQQSQPPPYPPPPGGTVVVALDEKLNNDDNVKDIDVIDTAATSGRRPDDDDDAQGSAAKITTTILTHKDASIRQLINDVETAYGDIPSGDGGSGVSSRWVDFLNWMSHPALGLQVMKENNMVIKMGDLSKRGAGQLYIDGRLIPGENMIDFISNMNNTRMMTIPHRWHYERNLTQFIDYLNSLDVHPTIICRM